MSEREMTVTIPQNPDDPCLDVALATDFVHGGLYVREKIFRLGNGAGRLVWFRRPGVAGAPPVGHDDNPAVQTDYEGWREGEEEAARSRVRLEFGRWHFDGWRGRRASD
jgi:hypothetical protein